MTFAYFSSQKSNPAGQAYQPSPFGDSAPPTGEMKLSRSLCQQPLRQPLVAARSRRGSDMPLAYHSLPRRHFVTPYTGEAMGWSAAYPLHKGAYEDSANSADIASKRSICIVQNISIKSII